MRITGFRLEDLDELEDHVARIPGMMGISMWQEEPHWLVACGGIASCPWGKELWIYTQPDITPRERVEVGRRAREYVRTMLDIHGEIYAHAWDNKKNRKWLEFLGLSPDTQIHTEGLPPYSRWKAEREELAWASK